MAYSNYFSFLHTKTLQQRHHLGFHASVRTKTISRCFQKLHATQESVFRRGVDGRPSRKKKLSVCKHKRMRVNWQGLKHPKSGLVAVFAWSKSSSQIETKEFLQVHRHALILQTLVIGSFCAEIFIRRKYREIEDPRQILKIIFISGRKKIAMSSSSGSDSSVNVPGRLNSSK